MYVHQRTPDIRAKWQENILLFAVMPYQIGVTAIFEDISTESKSKTKIMEQGSNLIEWIKTDLKAFEFGLIRFYPLNPLFPCSIKDLFASGLSGLGWYVSTKIFVLQGIRLYETKISI